MVIISEIEITATCNYDDKILREICNSMKKNIILKVLPNKKINIINLKSEEIIISKNMGKVAKIYEYILFNKSLNIDFDDITSIQIYFPNYDNNFNISYYINYKNLYVNSHYTTYLNDEIYNIPIIIKLSIS